MTDWIESSDKSSGCTRITFSFHHPTSRESIHISVLTPLSGWGRVSIFTCMCPLCESPGQGPVYPPVGKRSRIGLSCCGRPHVTVHSRSLAPAVVIARTSSRSASTVVAACLSPATTVLAVMHFFSMALISNSTAGEVMADRYTAFRDASSLCL